MAGYLLTSIIIIFFFYYQWKLCCARFNLYNTVENNDYDCLYTYSDKRVLEIAHIAYCIRQEIPINQIHLVNTCYGQLITFKELKSNNVNVNDLFQWNAAIEVIESYAKYILLSNLTNDKELYCKCTSSLHFGKYCQYKFYDDIDLYNDNPTFNDFVLHTKHSIKYPTSKEVNMEYVTCYVGIRCENSLPCLDWRQICNGMVDCDQAEDEPFELCLQMEVNECNAETEFRCKNGLCIPKTFAENGAAECLDGTDSRLYFTKSLSVETNYWGAIEPIFAEFSCPWKEYSCGDGQCISYSNATSGIDQNYKICSSKRNIVYLKQLFSLKHENQCWRTMMCLTGYAHLFSNITCSKQTLDADIQQHCPNEYYFPPNPVMYSFVFFLYEKLNRRNWLEYTGPNYICYRNKFCNKPISTLSTTLKNNLTCLYVNQTTFSWMNFSEYVIHLFEPCYSKFENSKLIRDKMLYKCELSNSFISLYRLKDKKKDCFFNEDENPNLNLCLFDLKDQFKCVTKQNECIRESSMKDGEYDCSDRSDEFLTKTMTYCRGSYCLDGFFKPLKPAHIYRFQDLCDKIVTKYLFPDEANETDETDCEYWPYKSENSPFTRCNSVWNSENGIDELNCEGPFYNFYIEKTLKCRKNQHYCLQLINNNTDINATCLNITRAGDGIIDCIGGTDERFINICPKKYPSDFKKRFYCTNSSTCIEPTKVCDGIIDCPFEDDERVCPWLFKTNSSVFHCKDVPSAVIERCGTVAGTSPACKLREQSWFCDLGFEVQSNSKDHKPILPIYPQQAQKPRSISFENIDSHKFSLTRKSIIRSNDVNINMQLCNYGYSIQSSILINKSYCLCPPTYYGDYCQYQRERLTVILRMSNLYYFSPLTVFRMIIYLLDENHTIRSYDEIIYSPKLDENMQFYVYLLYEKIKDTSLHNRSKSKYIRIDSYLVQETNVQYRSSWLFQVLYPFLPINKLVALLTPENDATGASKCGKKCGSHGKCMHYLNAKNLEYCWCDQGWFGEKCEFKSSSNLCNQTSCGPYSQCVILNGVLKLIKCVCPLGKIGDQCYIKYDPCSNISCQNNGTCLSLDQRSFDYICICGDSYEGPHCESRRLTMSVSMPAYISHSDRIPAAVVIIVTEEPIVYLLAQVRFLYKNILLPTTLVAYAHRAIAFIQLFHNASKNFYYLIAIQNDGRLNLNTSVVSSNLCRNVSELFNETVLYQYSYLKRLKLYHLPCNKNRALRCFFDEYRMCLCSVDRNSICYLFNHEQGNCNYCARGSSCIQQNKFENKMDFICICSECSFGSLCQFSTGNYFITLDLLIGIEMKTGNVSFNQQPFIIHLILVILIIMLVIGFISNIISFIILSNKKLRQVGCDLYLLNLTIVSQIGLTILFVRYLYMIIIQIYVVEDILLTRLSCIFLEYFVRLIPSLFDWLIVCISIERAYTVIKDLHFTRLIAMKTLKISRWTMIIIFIFNVLTTLHRPFHLKLIDEPTLNGGTHGHPWCILDFNSRSWNNYEKFINIFHLLIPLLLNVMSLILLICIRTRFQFQSIANTTEGSFVRILRKQLAKYKPLIISTAIVLILEMPRFILTFGFGCINEKWQRYLYLTGHLISFLPLTGTLLIHIIPSPKYRKALKQLYKDNVCRQKKEERN